MRDDWYSILEEAYDNTFTANVYTFIPRDTYDELRKMGYIHQDTTITRYGERTLRGERRKRHG